MLCTINSHKRLVTKVQILSQTDKHHYNALRYVHTMKVMHIGRELIHIVCVHTECALTAIRIECAFSQSTSIGFEAGLKANCIITGINAGVIYSRVIDCVRKRAIRKEITSVTLFLHLGKELYL